MTTALIFAVRRRRSVPCCSSRWRLGMYVSTELGPERTPPRARQSRCATTGVRPRQPVALARAVGVRQADGVGRAAIAEGRLAAPEALHARGLPRPVADRGLLAGSARIPGAYSAAPRCSCSRRPCRSFVGGVGALLGWLVPGFVLDYLTAQRQRVIQNGLPDALDLMIVCLEAGSAMDQAILKVSDELGLAYPALAEEFRMIITETRAGKPRLEAFRNFAARTGVEDVRSLVAMLVQTDRFGTSVSQALRTHAETSRTKRRQRAEERAAKIGVKMVFPLVFALFPAFFVVTLGPAVIKFIRVLYGQILGQ